MEAKSMRNPTMLDVAQHVELRCPCGSACFMPYESFSDWETPTVKCCGCGTCPYAETYFSVISPSVKLRKLESEELP